MAQHQADIAWRLEEEHERFRSGKYSRAHRWDFDGGVSVPASPAPSVVPPPMSDPGGVDPEEALVASLSSCHMLTFLHVAQKAGHVVTAYSDHAEGTLAKNDQGHWAITEVTLRPVVTFASSPPGDDELGRLHHDAHVGCFIANSVRTKVTIEPSQR